MRPAAAIVVLVAFALAAVGVALTSATGSSDHRTSEESKRMPILVRCRRGGDGHRYASADQVIAVARRLNHREVTHYQGRAVRRTRWNTPVQGLVMFVNDHTLDVPGPSGAGGPGEAAVREAWVGQFSGDVPRQP